MSCPKAWDFYSRLVLVSVCSVFFVGVAWVVECGEVRKKKEEVECCCSRESSADDFPDYSVVLVINAIAVKFPCSV